MKAIDPALRIMIENKLKDATRNDKGNLPTVNIAKTYNVSETTVRNIGIKLGLIKIPSKKINVKKIDVREENGNTISYSKPTLLPFNMIRSKLCQILVYNDRKDIERVKEAATYLLTIIDQEEKA